MFRDAHRASRLVLGATLVAACASAAQANWFSAYYGPTSYWAKFTKVPDFDQVRSDLPGSGVNYCVPVSAVNWMAYIAHHGYPTIMPGDHTQYYWHAQSNYNLSNFFLSLMGSYMNTDPVDGTYGGPAKAGLETWLDNRFIILHRWLNDTETPRFDDIAGFTRLRMPVMGCVGWYSESDGVLTRNGGHCFSVVKVQRQGSTRLLTMHDPGDEQANLFTQSAVAEQTYEIDRRIRLVGGQARAIDKLVGYGSGYLDAYFVIIPTQGLSTSIDLSDLLIIKPYKFTFDDSPLIEPVPAPGVITSLNQSPYAPWSVVTTGPIVGGPPSAAWRFDPDTRAFTPLLEFSDAQRAVFDRFGRYYVLDAATIRCFNFFGDNPVEEGSVTPEGTVEAMACDDVNDQLLTVLSDGKIIPYDRRLNPLPAMEIPSEVILFGDRFLATSPADGSMYITSQESPGVYHLIPATQRAGFDVELIGDGVLAAPTGLSVGDGDCVFVTDSTGATKVFCRDPDTGAWVENREHPLAALEGAAGIQMARSRTNFEPELHAIPAYDNFLPEEFAPVDLGCFADLDDDGVVDGADLGILLGAWGPQGETVADLTGDGIVDGADLGLLLGEWGDCAI
jgi:hypothetical protein